MARVNRFGFLALPLVLAACGDTAPAPDVVFAIEPAPTAVDLASAAETVRATEPALADAVLAALAARGDAPGRAAVASVCDVTDHAQRWAIAVDRLLEKIRATDDTTPGAAPVAREALAALDARMRGLRWQDEQSLTQIATRLELAEGRITASLAAFADPRDGAWRDLAIALRRHAEGLRDDAGTLATQADSGFEPLPRAVQATADALEAVASGLELRPDPERLETEAAQRLARALVVADNARRDAAALVEARRAAITRCTAERIDRAGQALAGLEWITAETADCTEGEVCRRSLSPVQAFETDEAALAALEAAANDWP